MDNNNEIGNDAFWFGVGLSFMLASTRNDYLKEREEVEKLPPWEKYLLAVCTTFINPYVLGKSFQWMAPFLLLFFKK